MTRTGAIPPRSATPKRPTFAPFCRWLFRLLLTCLLLPAFARAEERPTVVFLGDSLTAGFGLDPDEAYPALVQKKIDAAKLPWRVVNAGLSGDTTAAGLRRLDWILRQPAGIVVIELGANDGLRGIAPELTQANLKALIGRIRQNSPGTRVVLAGMQVPTNLGPAYTEKFAAIFPALAKECDVALIPFLLKDVGGHAALNQADGIHPTAEGQVKLADNVWAVLEPLLHHAPAPPP